VGPVRWGGWFPGHRARQRRVRAAVQNGSKPRLTARPVRPRMVVRGIRMGSVVKKRRKRMAKKKHRKLLRKTRVQRRRLGK